MNSGWPAQRLSPALCFLDKTALTDDRYPEREAYNDRVNNALQTMQSQLGTFAIFEPSEFGDKHACVLVENGKFYGMGQIPGNLNFMESEKLKMHITQYPENEVIKSMIRSFVQKYPARVVDLSG